MSRTPAERPLPARGLRTGRRRASTPHAAATPRRGRQRCGTPARGGGGGCCSGGEGRARAWGFGRGAGGAADPRRATLGRQARTWLSLEHMRRSQLMSSLCVMRPLWSTSARCQIAVRRSFLITGWSMFSPCTNASRSNRYWCLFIRPSILPPGTAAVKAARADRRFIHQASLTVSTNMSESNVVRACLCSAPRARSNSASESSRRAERSLWKPSSISSSFSASPPLEVATTERCRGPEPCGTRLFSGPRLPNGIAAVPRRSGRRPAVSERRGSLRRPARGVQDSAVTIVTVVG